MSGYVNEAIKLHRVTVALHLVRPAVRLVVPSHVQLWKSTAFITNTTVLAAVYYSATQQQGQQITLQQAQASHHSPFQAPQPKAAKREKKVIQITDPTTGRDITEEITHSRAPAMSTKPSSERNTPDGVSMVCICKSNLCMEYMLPPHHF